MANIQLSWELNEGALLTGLAKIEDRLNAIEGELKDVEEAGKDAFDKTGTNVKKLDNNLKKSQNGIFGTVNVMQKLTNAATIGFGALVAGATAAGVRAVNLAKNYEQTLVSFTTFLGSAQQARAVLAELEQFSLSTPFEPRQVQEAGKALLAFGIEADKLSPTLRAIGDLAAGTGKDFNELAVIYGKARTQGTLFAEDINQLTEAGIPIIAEFAKQFGVTEGEVKKLGSAGKIQFANLEQAFRDLTGEGGQFFNLMQNQSETFAGQLSTLQGIFDNVLRQFGESLLPQLKEITSALIDFIGPSNKASESIENLRYEFNLEIDVLKRANITQANRQKLINDINKAYGDYLPNLLTEKSTIEEIETAQKQANQTFLQRIIFAEFEEEVAEILRQSADAAKQNIEVAKQRIETNKVLEQQLKRTTAVDEEGVPFISNIGDAASQTNDALSSTVEGLRDLENETREIVDSTQDRIDAARERFRELAEAQGFDFDIIMSLFSGLSSSTDDLSDSTKKSKDELDKLLKKYNELSEALIKASQDAQSATLAGIDQLKFNRERAIKETQDFRNEFIKAAVDAGVDLPNDFYKNLDLIFNQITAEFIKELDKLAEDGEITQAQRRAALGYLPQATPEIVDDLNQKNQEQIQAIAGNISAELKRAEDQAQKEGFNFREFVQRTFNLSDEELASVERDFGQLVDSTIQALNFGTQLQITQQDQLISKLDERIQKQQELIDKEAQLAEEGYANNLDAEKANLEALNKERQRAAERRNEIERNAANRTLAIDAATQASRLTSTAIELFAGQARFGLPGILFAASALATLFSLIARARAQAQQFAQPVELRGGGLFDGPNLLSHESQRRTGKHHRIEGSNMAIEKGEWIIGTKHSKEHGSFLEALNAGKYSGIDLQESLAIAQTLNKRGRKVRAGADSVAVQSIIKRASGYDALQKKLDGVISSVEAVQAEVRRRPVVIPAGRSQVVTDDGIRREVKLIDVK